MTSNNEPTFLDMNDLCDASLEALIQHYLSVQQKLPNNLAVRERLLELEREQFNRELKADAESKANNRERQQQETDDNWRRIYTYDYDDTILRSTGSNNLYLLDVPWLIQDYLPEPNTTTTVWTELITTTGLTATTHTMKQMNKRENESTIWNRLKDWTKRRSKITCSQNALKTQERSNDGIFWEAEADIIRNELLNERELRRLRTDWCPAV